jgi:hypothetical protein
LPTGPPRQCGGAINDKRRTGEGAPFVFHQYRNTDYFFLAVFLTAFLAAGFLTAFLVAAFFFLVAMCF